MCVNQLSYLQPSLQERRSQTRENRGKRPKYPNKVHREETLELSAGFSACEVKVGAGQHGVYLLSEETVGVAGEGRSLYIPAARRCPSAAAEIAPKRTNRRNVVNGNRTYRLYIHRRFLFPSSRGGKHGSDRDCGYFRLEVGSMLSSRRSDTAAGWDSRKNGGG